MGASRSSGFTLVELVVALAIAAIALAAAARAVAENRVAELAARRAWPQIGTIEGSERQAGIEFPWRIEVTSTPHPAFRRVEVHVATPGDSSRELRKLVAVLPREAN